MSVVSSLIKQYGVKSIAVKCYPLQKKSNKEKKKKKVLKLCRHCAKQTVFNGLFVVCNSPIKLPRQYEHLAMAWGLARPHG